MGIDISILSPKAQKQVLKKLKQQSAQTPIKRTFTNQPPKAPKYHNEKTQRTMPNGEVHTFDSLKEAKRYDELMLLLKAGKIKDLRLQEQFTLQESYISSAGERVRAIKYTADFTYDRLTTQQYVTDGGGSHEYVDEWIHVVEDTKSKATKTPQYKLKKKLMQDKFNISISEI